jgi:hypothetical protein
MPNQESDMQILILSIILFTALALLVWGEMHSPSRHPWVRLGFLLVIVLALVGLLSLWGLPIATDPFESLLGA